MVVGTTASIRADVSSPQTMAVRGRRLQSRRCLSRSLPFQLPTTRFRQGTRKRWATNKVARQGSLSKDAVRRFAPEGDGPPSGGRPFGLLGKPNRGRVTALPSLLVEPILALHAL